MSFQSRFVLAALIAVVPGASRAQISAPTPPQIVVTGTAEAKVSSDRATVFVGVRTRASTAAAAAQENARKQRAVLDTLRAIGLTSDQLKTVNFSVSPETRYDNATQTTHVTGYTVSNTVVADLRHIDQVSSVIDASLAKGANEISSLQFYSSVADSARRAALADATQNARRDAETLARAAGGSLGNLLELSTQSPGIRPMLMQEVVRTAGVAGVSTPIEAGEQTITATVSARWAFVAGGDRGGRP